MADILVRAGTLVDGKIESLTLQLHKLADRVVDRDEAINLLKDGHSLIPAIDGERHSALQLVEIEGDEPTFFIRMDNNPTDEDSLPDLPSD